MADGEKHFEEPCNLILQDDNTTLQKEARDSSKQMVPTSPPNHTMSQPKIPSHCYHRDAQLRSILHYRITQPSFYRNTDAADTVLMLKKANISQRNLSVMRKEHDAIRLSASLPTHGQPQIFQGVNEG